MKESLYAKGVYGSVEVAQCLAAGTDDNAPYADVGGPEAMVFTQCSSRCGAFEVDAEVYEDAVAAYAYLDEQLARDAWA